MKKIFVKVKKKFALVKHVHNTIIYSPHCQKTPGQKFKKDNQISIFTFLKFFYILFLAFSYIK